MRTNLSLLLISAAVACTGLAMAGCQSEPMATVAYVDMKANGLMGQIDQLNGQVQTLNTQVAQANSTAQQASAKADEASRKAAGNFEHSVLYTDDSIRFDTSKSDLSQEDQANLMAFAQKLKTDNQNVYIEIQGHADSRGTNAYNMALGGRRAESVRRFLSDQGVPTWRMSTISLGDEKPKAPNDTPDGKAMNRRAVLVVEN
jgi:outer membrane protein OmpA-like peptidoglycan-associated protein